ncbi:MAG TPA: hypothetical protein DCY31_02270 [Ruminococcaceae bacterium]|nr:hypothetical protein [Oscillospiraceae bacterium]
MKENVRSLEEKLNRIIDEELKKDVSQIDDQLVMECCEGLLRMDNTDRYMITESEMKDSIDSLVGQKTGSVVKITKPLKILLIAAIIMVMLAIASLGYAQYKHNIFNFSDHSTILFNQSDRKRVDDFEVQFIPEGFVLNYESNNKYECSKEYVKGDDFFSVSKQSNTNEFDINTEYKNFKAVQINGIDYVEYGEENHGQGVLWEKDGYQYVVAGNISTQDLLKIAVSVSDKQRNK